jgi:hypothetical protein
MVYELTVEQYFHVGLPTGEVNNIVVQAVSKLLNGNLGMCSAILAQTSSN